MTAFAKATDPLVTQLRPAARELSPTLIALNDLAPDLKALFRDLDPLIEVSKKGLPATERFLEETEAAARPARPVPAQPQPDPRRTPATTRRRSPRSSRSTPPPPRPPTRPRGRPRRSTTCAPRTRSTPRTWPSTPSASPPTARTPTSSPAATPSSPAASRCSAPTSAPTTPCPSSARSRPPARDHAPAHRAVRVRRRHRRGGTALQGAGAARAPGGPGRQVPARARAAAGAVTLCTRPSRLLARGGRGSTRRTARQIRGERLRGSSAPARTFYVRRDATQSP